MNKDTFIYQLLTIRNAVDAILNELTEEQQEEGCRHPTDRRQNLGRVNGKLSYMCRDCGHVEEVEG